MSSAVIRYLLGAVQMAAASVAVAFLVLEGASVRAAAATVVAFMLVIVNVRLFGGIHDPFVRRLVSSLERTSHHAHRSD